MADAQNISLSLEAPDDAISGLLAVQEARLLPLPGSEAVPLPGAAGSWYILAAERGGVWVSAMTRSAPLEFPRAAAVPGDLAATLLPKGDAALLLLRLSGEAADRLLQGGGLFFPLGGGPVREAFHALAAEPGPVPAAAASAAAYRLLTQLYGTGRATAGDGPPAPKAVAEAMALMQRDFAFLDGPGDVAARLELSQEYLTRTFRKCAGITPGKYLNRLRVEHAKLLLRQEGRTVAFVSDACGFSSGNYFARVFRQFTGMSPGEYVRANREEAVPPEDLPGAFYLL